jgi:hypothetical protein
VLLFAGVHSSFLPSDGPSIAVTPYEGNYTIAEVNGRRPRNSLFVSLRPKNQLYVGAGPAGQQIANAIWTMKNDRITVFPKVQKDMRLTCQQRWKLILANPGVSDHNELTLALVESPGTSCKGVKGALPGTHLHMIRINEEASWRTTVYNGWQSVKSKVQSAWRTFKDDLSNWWSS